MTQEGPTFAVVVVGVLSPTVLPARLRVIHETRKYLWWTLPDRPDLGQQTGAWHKDMRRRVPIVFPQVTDSHGKP